MANTQLKKGYAIKKQKSGLYVGINKGHIATPRPYKLNENRRKGKGSTKKTFVRELIREVCGFAPYERRLMELIKNSREKRAVKLTKKRLGGSLKSAKRKVEFLNDVINKSKRQ